MSASCTPTLLHPQLSFTPRNHHWQLLSALLATNFKPDSPLEVTLTKPTVTMLGVVTLAVEVAATENANVGLLRLFWTCRINRAQNFWARNTFPTLIYCSGVCKTGGFGFARIFKCKTSSHIPGALIRVKGTQLFWVFDGAVSSGWGGGSHNECRLRSSL